MPSQNAEEDKTEEVKHPKEETKTPIPPKSLTPVNIF